MTKRPRPDASSNSDAAGWYARLSSDRCSPSDEAAFEAWRLESAAHAAAFAKTQEALAALDVARSSPEIAALRAEAALLCERDKRTRRRLVFGGGLSFAAALAGAVVLPRFPLQRLRYESARGQLKKLTLPDGTHLSMGSDTAIDVAFSMSRRNVRLERGEIFLTVQHDRDRPLVVLAAARTVTAVGTAFGVSLSGDRLWVTLLEGRVAIARPDTAPHLALGSGQQLAFDGAIETIRDVDASRELSWTRGMLDFDSLSLSEAVELFNRHGAARIVIVDPRLAGLRVGGAFRSNDTQAFVGALQIMYPVTATAQSSGDIVLDYREK